MSDSILLDEYEVDGYSERQRVRVTLVEIEGGRSLLLDEITVEGKWEVRGRVYLTPRALVGLAAVLEDELRERLTSDAAVDAALDAYYLDGMRGAIHAAVDIALAAPPREADGRDED